MTMLRSSMLAVALAVAAVAAAACGTTAAETPAAAGEPGGDTEGGESAPPRLLDDAEAARTETQAMQTHVQASGLLSRCEQEGDRAACEQAEDLFRVAADTWRALVEGRPDEAGNASWSFMLSQALLHAGSYARAAEAAATYVASGAEEWRAQAARIGVSASERAIEAEVLPVREEPPEAQGQPPEVEPAELPGHVLRLFDARASFVEVVGEAEPETARRYVLANAELLFRYGHWERAQAALREVFTAGCTGDGAWDGAAAAWRLLREMSLRLGRLDAVRLLGEEVTSLGCDFGEPDAPVCGADSDHPQCLARADAVSWRLSGGTRFMQRAERAGGDERRRWARRAGEAFLAALNAEGELDARGRVAALDEAAGAFRLAGDAERAAEVDRRIVRDVDPATLDEADRPFAVVTVASALARRLEEAILAERHAEVVELAERLGEEHLDLPELSAERERARAALPAALGALGRHADAARAFEALAAAADEPAERRAAELSAALALHAAGGCRRARRPLAAFVDAHRDEAGARDAVIGALWELAECERPGSRAHGAALEAVAEAGAEGAGVLGAEARGHVAEATFRLVDRDFDAGTRIRIRVPRGENIEELGSALRAELSAPQERIRELLQAYARVERIGDPRWSAAARTRSGLALESLERAVREAGWEVPNDLHRQRRELTRAAFEQLRAIVESRAAQILEHQAAQIRCRTVGHYRRAVEVAGAGGVDSEEAQTARERLAAIVVPARCPSGR